MDKEKFIQNKKRSEYGKQSEIYQLSGWLDDTAKDFPKIQLGWHGERMLFFCVSEKGFDRMNTEKKTLYMELSARNGQEEQAKQKIKKIVEATNLIRGNGLWLCRLECWRYAGLVRCMHGRG